MKWNKYLERVVHLEMTQWLFYSLEEKTEEEIQQQYLIFKNDLLNRINHRHELIKAGLL